MKYFAYFFTALALSLGFFAPQALFADYTIEDTNVFNVSTKDNGAGSSIDKNTGNISEKFKELLYGDAGDQKLIMDG